MRQDAFSVRNLTGKAAVRVYRHNRHYPLGYATPGKFPSPAAAHFWIERQTAEDFADRLDKVKAYLADRAARAPYVQVDANPDQLSMF